VFLSESLGIGECGYAAECVGKAGGEIQ